MDGFKEGDPSVVDGGILVEGNCRRRGRVYPWVASFIFHRGGFRCGVRGGPGTGPRLNFRVEQLYVGEGSLGDVCQSAGCRGGERRRCGGIRGTVGTFFPWSGV